MEIQYNTELASCPVCGAPVEAGRSCANCPPVPPAPVAGAGLWSMASGLGVWFSSVALIFGFQFVAMLAYLIIYFIRHHQLPRTLEIDSLLAGLSIGSTLPAHLMTLAICWYVVTGNGKRPFLKTLGWEWRPQFKWVHAVGLAFLMTGLTVLFEKYLPHKETDLEKLLKMGLAIRIVVASLAVVTAPLVEEVVYRGILYSGIERLLGKVAGVAIATLLFALVHVPQYWGSLAAITAILSLSLVLTLLRAWSGSILPCVATHLVYNGIQAAALLLAPDKMPVGPDQASSQGLPDLFLGTGLF